MTVRPAIDAEARATPDGMLACGDVLYGVTNRGETDATFMIIAASALPRNDTRAPTVLRGFNSGAAGGQLPTTAKGQRGCGGSTPNDS